MGKQSSFIVSQALAVKYRPTVFEDIVGQPSAVSQLKGIINSGKVPSSIMILGDTGQGKTTIARMLASYLNCATNDHCGTCPSCTMGDMSPDILERNMSDTRGIDDIRTLEMGSRAAPRFNYRVYLLDEIHQLTAPAQNAFLKTLEEPSKRTIFVLMTTNPEQLLSTIIGRCMKIHLTAIPSSDMSKRLVYIAKSEGFYNKLTAVPDWKKTISLISQLSNGGMREAISMLENVMYALESTDDPASAFSNGVMLKTVALANETDMDKQAADLMLAVLTNDLKSLVRSVRASGTHVRDLLMKVKWLAAYMLDEYAGVAKFKTTSSLILTKAITSNQIKVSIPVVVAVLNKAVQCERFFNSGADKSTTMISEFSEILRATRG